MTWFSAGFGSVRFPIGLGAPQGLFKSKLVYDYAILKDVVKQLALLALLVPEVLI